MANIFRTAILKLSSQVVTATGNNLYVNGNEVSLSSDLTQTGSNLDNRISNWGVKSLVVSGTNYSGNINVTGLGSITVDTNGNIVRISGAIVDSSTFVTAAQSGQFADKNALGLTGSNLDNRINNWGVKSIQISGSNYSGNVLMTGLGSVTLDTNGNMVRISGVVVDSSSFVTASQSGQFADKNSLSQTGSILGTRIDNWGVREIKITGQSFSGNLLLTGINNAVIDIQGGNLIRVNVETGYLAGYATTSSLASTGQQNYTNLNANAINLSGALANSGSVLYLASNPQNYSSSGNVLNTGQALYNLVTSLSGKLDSSGTNLQNQINSITSNTGLFYLNSNPSGFITNISGIVPSEIVYIYNNQNIGGNKLFSGNFTLYDKYPSGQNFTGVSGLVFRTGISGLFYLQDTGNQISVDIYNRILSGNWNVQSLFQSGQLVTTGGPYYPASSNPLSFIKVSDSWGVRILNQISGLIDITGDGSVNVTRDGQILHVSGNTGFLADYYKNVNVQNYISSGDSDNKYATIQNLTTTGVNLGSRITSLSGYLNDNFVDKSNPQSITGIKTFINNTVFQSGSGINFYIKGEPVLTGIVAGTNITVINNGGNFTVNSTSAGGNPSNGVTGVSITGGNSISGTISISQGSNISLLQIGNTGFSIASTAGGSVANLVSGISVTGSDSITGLIFVSGGTGILVSLSGNYININSTLNTGQFYPASNNQQYIKSGEAVRLANVTQAVLGEKTFSTLVANQSTFVNGLGTVTGLLWNAATPYFSVSSSNNLISADIENRTLSGQWNAQFPPKVSGQFLVTGNQTTINSLAGGAGEANTASNIGGGIGLFSGKQSVDLKFYSILGGTGINISLSGQQVSINSTANTGWESKSITVENPVPGDNITMFYTSNSISVKKITSIVRGGTTASGLFSIRFDPNRTLGTDLLNNGFSATGITTGNMFTSFTVPTITGNNFVWLFMNATGGNLSGLHTSLFYTNL